LFNVKLTIKLDL